MARYTGTPAYVHTNTRTRWKQLFKLKRVKPSLEGLQILKPDSFKKYTRSFIIVNGGNKNNFPGHNYIIQNLRGAQLVDIDQRRNKIIFDIEGAEVFFNLRIQSGSLLSDPVPVLIPVVN